MEATALALIGGVLLAALAIFFKQHRDIGNGKNRGDSDNSNTDTNQTRKIPPAKPYSALSITPGVNACEAAQRVSGRRYLLREAPKLPLAGCDPTVCKCRFSHHDDRRGSHEDRRHPSAADLTTQLYEATGESNRRKRKIGRRKTDWA